MPQAGVVCSAFCEFISLSPFNNSLEWLLLFSEGKVKAQRGEVTLSKWHSCHFYACALNLKWLSWDSRVLSSLFSFLPRVLMQQCPCWAEGLWMLDSGPAG